MAKTVAEQRKTLQAKLAMLDKKDEANRLKAQLAKLQGKTKK
jgi:hypothetical protein